MVWFDDLLVLSMNVRNFHLEDEPLLQDLNQVPLSDSQNPKVFIDKEALSF